MRVEITESKFNKWRTIIGVAHADGEIANSERAWLKEYFGRLAFSDEQRKQLEHDLDHGVEIQDTLEKVSEPRDRAQVLHFCRLLGHTDGQLHPNEKAVLEKIQAEIMSNVNLNKAIDEAENLAEQIRASQPKGFRGLFERFVEKLGV